MKQQPLDSTLLNIGHGSHEGMVGKNNEDSYIALCYNFPVESEEKRKTFHLNIVADGVGGQSAGERASKLTIETIEAYFDELEEISTDDVLLHISQAVTQANTNVYEQAHSGDSDFEGMATTIVISAVLDGLLFTSHIGDSRAYLLRDDHFYVLSKDHSWVQEAIDAGLLTPEQAKRHPNRNIIRRSIGTIPFVEVDQNMNSPWEPQLWQGMPLQQGDKVLICSDGLNDMISDYNIKASLTNTLENAQFRVEELIDKANRAGGRDNITVILLEVTPEFAVNTTQPIPPPEKPAAPPPPPAWVLEQDPPTIKHMPKISHDPSEGTYEEENEKQEKTALFWILVAAVAIAIIVLIVWLLLPDAPPPPAEALSQVKWLVASGQ